MNKFIKIALTAILALTLTACGEKPMTKEEAFQYYSDALANVAKVDSYNCDVEMNYLISDGSNEIKMGIGMNLIIEGQTTNAPKAMMAMETQMFGMDITGEIYYADGYVYTNTMGEKTKVLGSIDTLEEFKNTAIDIKNFEDIKITKKDGITTLEFKMNNDQLNQMLGESMGDVVGDDSLKYTDTKIIVTVNADNMINDMDVSVAATMNDGTAEANITVQMKIAYTEYNSAKVILPADLDSYTLVS
ncbi:MAG: DUF6612 family protein [Anaerorhabdus sp.]|uniref:DUF6612 family protein n=1 Tax=Anaerorhabdus sp. TaxID=1872524 RepID=UPI003A8C6217